MTFYMVRPGPALDYFPDSLARAQVTQALTQNVVSPTHGKDTLKLPIGAIEFAHSLNPGRHASMLGANSNWQVMAIPNTGWLNRSAKDWWKMKRPAYAETVVAAWNVVEGIEFENDPYGFFVKIRTLDMNGLLVSDYENTPAVIHRLTCIRRDGGQARYFAGYTLYYPLLSRQDMYMSINDLERFPELPMDVVLSERMNIRLSPSLNGEILTYMPTGKRVTIYTYSPRGDRVWGFMGDGWICLRDADKTYTNWRMNTPACLPAVPVYPLTDAGIMQDIYGWGL